MLIKPGPFSSACCVGGFAFATPIPSARAVHLIILILTDSCLPKQHLPSNWITNEENCYYPNSLLPVNFGIGT